MVLSILALSIRGLIRRIRLETSASARRRNSAGNNAQPDSEATATVMDDERGAVVLQAPVAAGSAAVGVAAGGDRGERVGERGGFMTAALMVSSIQPMVSRTASSKRKLEELEIGVAESSAAANSQVRARREARDEVLEGSIAESSGRERYEGGICVSGEAQALDGETQMRDEGGNEATDADAMWEEESGWNKTSEGTKVPPEERVEEIVVGGGAAVSSDSMPSSNSMVDNASSVIGFFEGMISEAGSSLGGSALVSSQVDSGAHSTGLLTSSLAGVISGGESLVSSDVGNAGRGLESEEDAAAGKDGESSKETESDGLRSRERDSRESALFGHEEELSTRRYGNLTAVIGAGLDAGVAAQGASASLSGYVSTVTAGVSGGNGDASCSRCRPMVIDKVANPCRLQFFVRTYIDGRTVVLHANASDSIESVHQQILLKTGLPVSEQRLIFGGRQLQHDQTLEWCHVVNDATLNLVARMRSTALPHSWQLINDLVATIRRMCAAGDPHAPHVKLMHSQDQVRAGVQEFLKMASKSVPVSEHMQVFQFAGATSALVMLLLSQVESNRECAEESITHFLQANDEYLPAHIHCHCASVLLDFCKLLAKSAPSHSLYSSCRNALARLLDSIGVAHGSQYFYEAKADSIVHDFSPFVNELSLRLSANLRWIAKAYTVKEASINFASYVKEAKDFTAFVIPLCKAMEVCKGIDASGSSNGGRGDDSPGRRYSSNPGLSMGVADGVSLLNDVPSEDNEGVRDAETTRGLALGMGVEIGTHGWLRTLFLELLEEIDNCLKAVGHVAEKSLEAQGSGASVSDDRERPLGWAPFLVVLKGLHAIAKLYEGAMSDLLKVLTKRYTALNVLIRQSRWQDDDFWLLDYKCLVDFESKRRLVMAMLPEPQDDHDERQEIVVHRSQLLTESFELLAYVEPDGLQGGISVEFATEEATGPGVLREWFSMICREIFNCQNALFLPCPKDRRRFFPNPASGVNPGHLTYFRFCGRVIALALMHRVQVDVVFAVTFFKQLAGLPISWEDAKDADPVLYESCKKILEMDSETIDSDVLGLTFVSEVEELGSRKTLELCQGGKEMVVNSENRRQFVELLVQRRLVASVADQIKSFSQGFSDLLVNATHQQFLRALEPEDLDLMLYGKDRNICLEDWRKHTEYHDYTADDTQIIWFWKVISTMMPEQRRRLLFFSTSVTHLPAEGFAGLSSKFHIHRAHTDTSWLPTAHTCFYQLVLPVYPTYEIMHVRLHAITEVHIAEGFGFA